MKIQMVTIDNIKKPQDEFIQKKPTMQLITHKHQATMRGGEDKHCFIPPLKNQMGGINC